MNERGYSIIESLWSMLLGSLMVTGLLVVTANTSRGMKVASDTERALQATQQTATLLEVSLRALETNRLRFSATITRGDQLRLANGTPHPLASLSGTTMPRPDSDILSIVAVSFQHHARLIDSHIVGSAITARVCDSLTKITPSDFKSFVVYTLNGPHQVVGQLTVSSLGCYNFSGAVISGLISKAGDDIGTPLSFMPVEREHSVFIDRTGNLRIASHVGTRITENQPLTRGLRSFRLQQTTHTDGASIFFVTIQGSAGHPLLRTIVPGLAYHEIWNEVLP
jgi:hypothetical protein